MTLQVTQNCNLRCDYCVFSGRYNTRSHSNERIKFETAKKGIDFLIEHSSEFKSIMLGFYGGEPLLEYQLIKNCVKYVKERAQGKIVEFNITTNATLDRYGSNLWIMWMYMHMRF